MLRPTPLRAPGPQHLPAALSVLTPLLCFAVYLKTLCPTVYVGDSGEVASVAWMLDICHPTGYPLYSMLGRTFALLAPFGSIVFRINLFSAICSALTVFLLFRIVSHTGFSSGIAAIAAGVVGLSLTFWSQSVISEVYGLHLLLLSAILVLLLETHQTKRARCLHLMWFLVGLSLGNHLSTVLLAPVIALGTALLLLRRRLPIKAIWPAACFFIFGGSIYLYLPIRAAVPYLAGNWGNPQTLGNFLSHVTGRQFGNLMFSQPLGKVLGNLRDYLFALWRELSPVGLIAVAAGFALMLWRDRARLAIVLMVWAPFVFWAINYDVVDVEVFYLPGFLAFAPLLAAALEPAIGQKPGPGRRSACVGLIASASFLLLAAPLVLSFHANNRATHTLGYDYARLMTDTPCEGACIYTFGWSSPFVLHYVHSVEGFRPDIDVRINWGVRNAAERTLGLSKSDKVYYEFPSQLDDAPSRRLSPDGVLFHITKVSDTDEYYATTSTLTRARSDIITRADTWYDWLSLAVLSKMNYMMGAAEEGTRREALAREHLALAEKLGQGNAGVLNNIGSIYFQAGLFADALRMFQVAYEADPGLVLVAMNIPACYVKMGQYEAAIEAYKSLGGVDFGYPYIHLIAGDAYVKTGRYEAAATEYQKAIQMEPQLASAVNNLGTVYDAVGKPAQAIKTFKRALEIDPDFASPYNNLATIALRQGQIETARTLAQKAIELDPTLADALSTLGNIESMAGHYREAESLYKKAIQKGCFNASVLNNLAVASLKLGDVMRAHALLQAALSLDPDFGEALKNMAIVDELLGGADKTSGD
ncbi:MAG: DUF2723 domain-containing protein [Candidatus Coatesbacteria bacterium]|nr:DUF2723 domain-containing protein [Candidatus Coatesbacteria bacterium]